MIDWSRPWLAPWRARGEPLEARSRQVGLAAALDEAASAAPLLLRAGVLRFVDQSRLPAGEAYEAFIARTAQVPTRPASLHDFFNGLAWLVQPVLKRRLNELQADQLATAVSGAHRGALRDALTLLDENAALLEAPASLIDALRARDWPDVFGTHRRHWAEARVELFGHALLEKLERPRKAITAHVWVVSAPLGAGGDSMSERLAASLTAEGLAARGWLVLPVLGVPGWWAANEAPAFYDDASVFRSAPPGAPKETAAERPLS